MTGQGPFTPRPPRPKLRIRLAENSPFVDLDVTGSDLVIGVIETIGKLCVALQVAPTPPMARAIDNLAAAKKLHRKA